MMTPNWRRRYFVFNLVQFVCQLKEREHLVGLNFKSVCASSSEGNTLVMPCDASWRRCFCAM
jgi:hypothetical protein